MTVMTKELSLKLEEARKKKLLPLLKETLIQTYPKECRLMKEEYLEEFLNQSYTNAQKTGTQSFGEIKTFTFLAFNLGIDFNTDPIYKQINNIFQSTKNIKVKLDRATNHYLKEQMLHTQTELIEYKMALMRLEKVAYTVITETISAKKMANYLKAAYPQRVEKLGGVEHLEKLIPTHYEQLEANKLNTPLGHFVYFMLWMFMGSSMLSDPHYRWIQTRFYAYEEDKAWKFQKVLMKRLKKELKNTLKEIERMNDGLL